MTTLSKATLDTAAQMFAENPDIQVCKGRPQTDGKRVYLPGIKEDLTPSEMRLLRGYFAHECAHIKYDSFSSQGKAGRRRTASKLKLITERSLHSLFNCFEDVRIEHKLRSEKIGSRDTIKAIHDAAEQNNNSEGVEIQNLNGLFNNMVHAMIWYMQGRSPEYAKRGMQEFMDIPKLKDVCDRFMAMLNSGKDMRANDASKAASTAARIIDAWFCAKQEEKRKEQEDSQSNLSSDNTDDADDQDSESPESSTEQSAPSSTSSDEDTSADGGQQSVASSQSCNEYEGSTSHYQEIDISHDAIKTIETFDDVAQDPTSAYDHRQPYGRMPGNGTMLNEYSCHWKYADIHADAMRITRSLRPLLGNTDKVSWSAPRESGHRPDMRAMPQLACGASSRALNVKRIDHATKTLVTILIDQSSSMRHIRRHAMRSCMTMADSCESMGVKCGVIGFSHECWILKNPGEKVTPMLRANFHDCGGTNFAGALMESYRMEAGHPRHKHVQFLLTDGSSGDTDQSLLLLKASKEAGVQQYGIDICGGMYEPIENYYKDQNTFMSLDEEQIKDGAIATQLEAALTAVAKEAR